MDSECFLSPDNYIELFQKNHVSGPSREHVPTPRRTAPSVQRRPELSNSWIWRGEGQTWCGPGLSTKTSTSFFKLWCWSESPYQILILS